MAEKYNQSPIGASLYAIRTKKHAQQNNTLPAKNNLNTPPIKHQFDTQNDIETESRTSNRGNFIAYEEDEAIDEENDEIRKNVWSDVDDELYIAELIRERTNVREKRDTSDYLGDISEVVSSVKVDYDMWEIDPTDLTECDCLGPPPEFLLPPPPRPPFLHSEYYCGDDPIPDLETCDTEPVSNLFLLTCERLIEKQPNRKRISNEMNAFKVWG